VKPDDSSEGWPQGWLVASAAALFAALMAWFVGDFGLFAAVFVAIFVFLVFGVLLGMFWTRPTAQSHGGNIRDTAESVHQAERNAAPAAVVQAPGALAQPVADAQVIRPVVPLEVNIAEEVAAEAIAIEDTAPPPAPDQPVLAAPEAVATDDGMAQAPVAEALIVEPAQKPSELSRPLAFSADEARATGVQNEAPIVGPIPDARKPQGLAGARDSVPDKLQTIDGIGPVLESLCHEMGIYHFDQIAAWSAAETAWMDANLRGFKGRVTRDKWVRQAVLIGAVGVDEFLRRTRTDNSEEPK